MSTPFMFSDISLVYCFLKLVHIMVHSGKQLSQVLDLILVFSKYLRLPDSKPSTYDELIAALPSCLLLHLIICLIFTQRAESYCISYSWSKYKCSTSP